MALLDIGSKGRRSVTSRKAGGGLHVWRIGWNGALDLATLPHGTLQSDGRWHLAADRLPVVYASSSRALCQLEKRVHCNGYAPKNLALMRLELPAGAALEDAGVRLQPDWRDDMRASQSIGSDWATKVRSLGLWVPSFVEAAERNLVLNPRHAQYGAIRIVVERNPFEFDPRLFG